MNIATEPLPVMLSIAAVERDTGLSKDTLRVWERRYGFPSPERDAVGERAYPLAQVERLRVIKRLLDAGHRPGRIVRLTIHDLQRLAESTVDQPQRLAEVTLGTADLRRLVELLQRHDLPRLRLELGRLLVREGVLGFVTDVVAPLTQAVGDAWMRGQLRVFEEHLYSELAQALLRQAIASIPPPSAAQPPHVLLTTLPGEPHGLGLLMAEAVFALEGCRCTPLGPQTPLMDIVQAAVAMQVDVVALGFAATLGARQTQTAVAELREKLPATVALWAGGSAPGLHRCAIEGLQVFESLRRLPAAIAEIDRRRTAPPAAAAASASPLRN